MKKFIAIILVLAIAGGGYWYWKKKQSVPKEKKVVYRKAKVMLGTITQEVSATGTVQPMKEVEVGTQVTGKIMQLNADFNSNVKEGDIVALIDPATYEASFAAASAQLKSSMANLEKTKTELALAEKELTRLKALLDREMISASEYDSALAVRDKLKADIKINEASIDNAKANTKQAKTNLEYCTIKSPVTGVVIDRSVDEGQTVVSNMNASTLFKIAADLSKVKVEASIPEADVGQLKVGQTVRFTVDAYRRPFTGTVKQIRLAAVTSSNVVTYPVIVEADNKNGLLFPGMTATLSIIVAEVKDCLCVPAAALRFKKNELPQDFRSAVWRVKPDGEIEPVKVKLGISDSINYQIDSELKEGDEIAIGIMTEAELKGGGQQVNNPFMMRPPGMRGGNRGGAGGNNRGGAGGGAR